MSFSDEDASAWNVFAAEEHLGGRSSSLGRRGCEGTWRMLPHLPNAPHPRHTLLGSMPSIQGEGQHQSEPALLLGLFAHPSLQHPPLGTLIAYRRGK